MKCCQFRIGYRVLCLCLCLIAIPAITQGAGTTTDHEVVFWESVRDSNNIDLYRAYIKKYPNGHFVPIAQIKIDTLSKNEPREASNSEPKSKKKAAKTIVPVKRLSLRSKSVKLDGRDVRDFIRKYNFSDPSRNPGGRFENNFSDNQDGTISAETTGLIWQKSSSEQKLDIDRANAYIEKLNLNRFAGRSNWRLPTLEELLSLMKHEPQAPNWFYIDAIFYKPNDWFLADRVWSIDSKNPEPESLYGGWVVNFWRGTILPAYWGGVSIGDATENDENYVKAVCTNSP